MLDRMALFDPGPPLDGKYRCGTVPLRADLNEAAAAAAAAAFGSYRATQSRELAAAAAGHVWALHRAPAHGWATKLPAALLRPAGALAPTGAPAPTTGTEFFNLFDGHVEDAALTEPEAEGVISRAEFFAESAAPFSWLMSQEAIQEAADRFPCDAEAGILITTPCKYNECSAKPFSVPEEDLTEANTSAGESFFSSSACQEVDLSSDDEFGIAAQEASPFFPGAHLNMLYLKSPAMFPCCWTPATTEISISRSIRPASTPLMKKMTVSPRSARTAGRALPCSAAS